MNGEKRRKKEMLAEAELRGIADEVRAYLQAHPHAADSLSSILEWWLEKQRAEREARKVRRALELLVQEGLVVREGTPDGGIVYRAARIPPT